LGDPWKDRWFCDCEFRLGLFCPRVAGSPPGGRGRSARSFSAGCSLCSSRVLQALSFNPFDPVGLVARGWADSPRGDCKQSTRRRRSAGFGGQSVFSDALLEVWESISGTPPRARGWSAWCSWIVRPLHANSTPKFDEDTTSTSTSSTLSYSRTGSTIFGTIFWANYLGPCKRVQLCHDAEE
jgi:hypothetical protein